MKLWNENDVPTPPPGEAIVFRRLLDARVYYKNSDGEVLTCENDGGNVFTIASVVALLNITRLRDYTDEKLAIIKQSPQEIIFELKNCEIIQQVTYATGVGGNGKSGYSGYSGYSGTNGTNGASGISGYSGYSGLGLSGYSGYSGANGVSGATGISGYSGYSGAPANPGEASYGEMYITNNSTSLALTLQNTFYKLDSSILWVAGDLNGVSFTTGDSLTCNVAGAYLLTATVSYTVDAGNQIILASAFLNGAQIVHSTNENRTTAVSDVKVIILSGIVAGVQAGDVFDLRFLNTTSAGKSIVPIYVEFTLSAVAGASGFSGYSGYSGTNGTNGASGISGYSGYSGTNGTNGASGISGYSGVAEGMYYWQMTSFNPADATTYHVGPAGNAQTTDTNRQFVAPFTFTISEITIVSIPTALNGSAGTSAFSWKNITTATTTALGNISFTQGAQITRTSTFSGLAIAVTAGDAVVIQWDTPTWTANPTGLVFSIYIKYSV